ncbi:jg16872 [Pararge aegeria aegeria]|uniref:Jg16872 protein n=1 Tax=Pararge aegeria aegeria TaxID=348720 RepID=A0A8S4SHT2_9NEOP|nr:jg16872 [Pararge aegeria aegeria]
MNYGTPHEIPMSSSKRKPVETMMMKPEVRKLVLAISCLKEHAKPPVLVLFTKMVYMITGYCPLNKHLFNLCITESPLCRAYMEVDKTPTNVMPFLYIGDRSSRATRSVKQLGTMYNKAFQPTK